MLIAGLFACATAHAEWQLVWSDEFDKPGRPDPAKWSYEVGYIRNKEAQYYTSDRKENARVENGLLILEARKELFPIPGQGTNTEAGYTSASLMTRGKASWTYGRMEMRAKLPQGKGVWPAFWTLGDQGHWPKGGEIDIMEFLGKEPDKIHGTIHFADPYGKHRSNGGNWKTEKPYEDFHLFAVEWFADRIDFYFDNHKYHTSPLNELKISSENPFEKPHYLIVNLALGGSWGGEIDDSIFPQRYEIDYIRVYQIKK